ncbi:MAG: glycosyltransferase family 39 protein, partial [Anaerolineales bacterium]
MKLGLLALDVFPFNADEAVVGLMAGHILEGRWPVFFYGQAYMGSMDASLVAIGFALFGQRVIVIRAVQILLYLGTVFTTMQLGRRIFRSTRVALIAGLLMAIPAVNVTLYTTVSLGGYGEMLLIGNLLLLLALRIAKRKDENWPYLVWGFLAGLGFWA